MKLSLLSKGLLVVVAGLFVASLFLPMWRMELDAPQYPEGLVLQLFTDKIGGDVENINGLNHYIGMQTLHTENFFEFTVLPYIMSFFAALALIVLFVNKRKAVLYYGILLLLFVALAGIDFYRWNYEYGHNLDPHAAIKVPGMAYQPPVLGFKQLLNFGVYSIPDTGGWLLIGAGAIVGFIILKEYKFSKKTNLA